MTPELSCELASRWLSRAIDEEISSREEALLESHLDTCTRCREERERLFSEIDWIEQNWAGVSDEIGDLLRDRIGDDAAAVTVPPEGSLDLGSSAEGAAPAFTRHRGRILAWAAAIIIVAGGLHLGLDERAGRTTSVVSVEYAGAGLWIDGAGRREQLEGTGQVSLHASTRFEVPPGGDAYVHFEGGSRARVGAEGVLRITDLDDGSTVELTRGRATFQVAPRSADHPFIVRTPLAEIRVVGTLFGVIHDGERTRVEVTEGTVEVRRRLGSDTTVSITAGRWIVVSRDRFQYPPPPEAAALPSEGTETGATVGPGEGPAGAPVGESPVGVAPGGDEGGEGSSTPAAAPEGPVLDMPSGGQHGASRNDDEED